MDFGFIYLLPKTRVGPQIAQDLLLITKDEKGKIKEEKLMKVRFVEMVGTYGWGTNRF